jgi:hypothetical protein
MIYKKFYPAKKYKFTTYPLYFLKEMLIKRRQNEKDNVILITGARGEGKSTLAGKILFQFPEFNPYENVVYTQEAFFKELKKKNNYVWADEGIISAAKGNVMTRANKLLHQAITINRDNYNIVFFLLPFVEDFDTKILQYVSCWLHVDTRGLAIMMLPSNKGLFGKRNWDVDQMKKIYDEFLKENAKTLHAPYWLFQNFRGYVRFGKLTKEQDIIIKEIKTLRKNESLDKEMKDEVVVEVKQMDNYNKYSAKKLADMVHIGEIRDIETFNATCTDMKLDPIDMLHKIDNIFKRNDLKKTSRMMFKEYQRAAEKLRA